jgi:hypothetical protein
LGESHSYQCNSLSVFKTDKIANLHGHEVLRTPVRHCELNLIELIWAQVKGFFAENNTTFCLKDVMYNLSFTTGIPVQSLIMLDWIQLSSSSSKSIIIGGISLLSMQFSFPYSFSIFNTTSVNLLAEKTVLFELFPKD